MIDITKIIHAPVGGGRYTVTAPIVKEDYGLYLLIEGLELPSTYEVDFSNSEHNGTSVTMIGNADGVLIPRQFITTGKDVFAFLYHVGADYGRTVYKFRIPNKLRPDRTNEEPTPEEQSVIDQAINALNEAVAQTAQDVIDADQSAQSAQEYAEQAESARDTAQTYANNASASATSASQSATASANSATASAQSASQSAQIKADVEDLAEDAQGYAQASAQSASSSANSASQAQGYAQSASSSAQSASGYASQAQSYSQTASAKAQDASQSASTASQKATEASQSASQALTYKTDAESAKTSAQTAQGLAESARDSAISAQESAEDARDEAQNLVDGISGKVEQIDANTADIASLEDDRYKPYAVDTASGAVASFSDGANGIPLKSLIVNIDPVQDLSNGDPSPTNICPISGWTGMQLKAMGKNLLDPTLLKDQSAWNTIRFYAPVGTPLTFSANQANRATSGLIVFFRHPTESMTANNNVYVNHPVTKIVKDVGYVEIVQRNADSLTSFTDWEYQIEIGDEVVTPYEPYNGTTIPISWQTEAGTVYGGKLDVLSGVMRVDSVKETYNGTEAWIIRNPSSTSKYFTHQVGAYGDVAENDIICDAFKQTLITGSTQTIGINVVNSSGYNASFINLRPVGYMDMDVDAFKAWLAEHPITVVYGIANPITAQLDAHTINSIYGQNNIFADTGGTSAEYRADTTLYISRLTEPDADMTADANITSGQYFMVGNSLYKATANIANGSAIVVGTNCIRKSLSEALNEINA